MTQNETFILRTETTALFLADYGFHTYDIIQFEDYEDKEEIGINKRDISSWTHEFKDVDINEDEIVFCRCDLEEFKKKHSVLYAEWVKLPHGFRNEEERKENDKKQNDLVLPLHKWLDTFPINKETEKILDNEVYKEYCSKCNKYYDEDFMRFVEKEAVLYCEDCLIGYLEDEYRINLNR